MSKAGRPKSTEEIKEKMISLRILNSTYYQLKVIAQTKNMYVSELIRTLIETYLCSEMDGFKNE